MSDTVRSIANPRLLENADEYVFIEPGKVWDRQWARFTNFFGENIKSAEELMNEIEKHNKKWRSSKWHMSCPKAFRRMKNRSDRSSHRRSILRALREDSLDALVIARNPLPYWD